MRWPTDMGGMDRFGPVQPEKDEPLFHAAWERRMLGLMLAAGGTGAWTIDESRHAREQQPSEKYWSSSYYEIWLNGLAKLLQDRGLVTAKDFAAQRLVDPPKPVKRVLMAGDVVGVLARGSPYDRLAARPATYKPGDSVRTRTIDIDGHTRLPRYAQNKPGEIVRVHGCHVFPDSSGVGLGENPQWLYSVKFRSAELWGKPSPDHVFIDLWEPYLERL